MVDFGILVKNSFICDSMWSREEIWGKKTEQIVFSPVTEFNFFPVLFNLFSMFIVLSCTFTFQPFYPLKIYKWRVRSYTRCYSSFLNRQRHANAYTYEKALTSFACMAFIDMSNVHWLLSSFLFSYGSYRSIFIVS